MALTLDALLEGLSDPEAERIVTLDTIKFQYATGEDRSRLTVMDPMVNKYLRTTKEINRLGSLMQLSRDRLFVSIEYLIFLSEIMEKYEGVNKNQKIMKKPLNDRQKQGLRAIPEDFGFNHQKQIEYIESITKHDLGATTDWLKIVILQHPEVQDNGYADGVHFGLTSDDINSVAFGIMNTEILRGVVLPVILRFQENLIEYALKYDSLAIAGLTHGQPAEFTTLSKRFMNIAESINDSLLKFIPYNHVGEHEPLLFPAKMSGAVGNYNDLRAAYPDIDWPKNIKRLIESFGLKYKEMTDQSTSFVEYQHVAGLLNEVVTTIEKFAGDLWGSIEDLMFDKIVKKGEKGSSVMAQKKNPWLLEGGIEIMRKGAVMLQHTTERIRLYHFEGDMSRSILTRDIPSDYARIVLGIARIGSELMKYVPNEGNVVRFLEENPGISTAPIMTVLKRADIGGDAYRLMQYLSYDTATGRNKTRQEYEAGLKDLISKNVIPKQIESEVMDLLIPEKSLGYAQEFTTATKQRCLDTVSKVKQVYELNKQASFKFK